MDTLIAFYLSLGFTVKERWDDFYAIIVGPGITIGLHPSKEKSTGSGNISIGFAMDNVEETKKELNFINVKYTERIEEGGDFLHFQDPDKTELYFIKSKW